MTIRTAHLLRISLIIVRLHKNCHAVHAISHGAGLAIKAFGGRYFSVLVFAIAQVAMDIEPLIGMIRGSDVLHGWSHSYVGATAIGVLVMLLAPPALSTYSAALKWRVGASPAWLVDFTRRDRIAGLSVRSICWNL